MDFNRYVGSWTKSKSENRISRLAILIMAFSILVLVANQGANTVKVEMTPSRLSGPGWIDESAMSSSMKETWAFAIAETLGNVTPRTVDFVADRLGPLVSPAVYADVMKLLAHQAKTIKQENVTTQFAPTAVFYVPSDDVVVVSGEYTMRGLRQSEKRSVRTYEIRITMENYRAVMSSLDVYDGPWSPMAQGNNAKNAAR